MNDYSITNEYGYKEDYSYLNDVIERTLKKEKVKNAIHIILYTKSLFKKSGKCLLIALKPIYKRYPAIPPTTFKIISSISNDLPILNCTNSTTPLVTKVVTNTGHIFLGFTYTPIKYPNGTKIIILPKTL